MTHCHSVRFCDAYVTSSLRALHMDEDYYPQPNEFKPERYEGRTRLADHYQGNPNWRNRDHYGM